MSRVYLILAIVFEVAGTSLLKGTDHVFSLKTAAMLFSYGVSLFLLSLTLKKMDVGIVYALWSGLGITAIQIVGVAYFKETLSVSKVIFILLILIGTVGLNFTKTA